MPFPAITAVYWSIKLDKMIFQQPERSSCTNLKITWVKSTPMDPASSAKLQDLNAPQKNQKLPQIGMTSLFINLILRTPDYFHMIVHNERISKWVHLSFYHKQFSRYLHLKFEIEVFF